MSQVIPLSAVVAAGFLDQGSFEAAADAFEAALAAHASTVGQAAPTAHPLVEAAVSNGYVVVDDTPEPPAHGEA